MKTINILFGGLLFLVALGELTIAEEISDNSLAISGFLSVFGVVLIIKGIKRPKTFMNFGNSIFVVATVILYFAYFFRIWIVFQ